MNPGMKWASALSEASRLEDAVEEAGDSLRADLEGAHPDVVWVFASADHADHYSRLVPQLQRAFDGSLVLGCSAGGVIGDAREVEFEPGLSLTAASLPDVELTPFYLGPDAEDWDQSIATGEPPAALVVLPDPYSVHAESLVQWLDASYPEAAKIGGLASGGSLPGESALFLGDTLYRSGTVGLAVAGDIAVDTVVAQGCRPIGSPMFATRVEGHAIFELDGKPAVAVLENLYRQLPSSDQQLLQTSLFLGLVMDPDRHTYNRGDFLVRNLIGLEREQGAILVGARPEPNMVVQFQLRDADTSTDDLKQLLAGVDHDPAGALLFSCMGRGRMLYGAPNHDSNLFTERMGPTPLGGFFCNGEIGPVQGRTFLHGYTSSFGLFRRRY